MINKFYPGLVNSYEIYIYLKLIETTIQWAIKNIWNYTIRSNSGKVWITVNFSSSISDPSKPIINYSAMLWVKKWN